MTERLDDADTVVVMVDGRIIERGGHDELLTTGGAYARLWNSRKGQDAATTGAVRPV